MIMLYKFFITFLKNIFVISMLITISACPATIDLNTISQISDSISPEIILVSPVNNDDYTQTVTVSGTVSDGNGQIKLLSYSITGTLGVLESGIVDPGQINTNGDFSFQFGTIEFNGPIVLDITAEDWNDNLESISVILNDPGSAISSFEAMAGNKNVSLKWDSVNEAISYSIFYTDDGTLPSESYGQNISTSLTDLDLSGLDNGKLHTFLLKVDTPSGGSYWSDYLKVIPMSQFTLAPKVEGQYRQIFLEWAEIEGSSEFEVLRSLTPDGSYTNYSGIINGNNFVDTAVNDDQWYYYKIRANLEGSLPGTFNGAQTSQVPTIENRISNITTPSVTDKIKISENYAYVASGTGGLQIVDISNPSSPSYLSSISTTDAKDLVIEGNTLYLADGAGGLKTYNISVPTAPTLLDTYVGSIGDAAEISIADGRCFILDSSGGTAVYALNIGDPSNIVYLANYTNANYTLIDIEVSYYNTTYTFIYISGYDNTNDYGILLENYFYSVNNTIAAYRSYNDSLDNFSPQRVTVSDDRVYVLGRAIIFLEPPPPFELLVFSKYPDSFVKTGETSSLDSGYVADIKTLNDKIYLVDGIGFTTYDVSIPDTPVKIDYIDTPAGPTGIDTDGSYAYIASGVSLFQTVDLNLPLTPSVIGSYSVSGVVDAKMRGDYVYAAATASPRLQIIDMNNLTLPDSKGSATLSSPVSIALSGNYAFVSDSGIKILDVSNPDNPFLTGTSIPITGSVKGIDVKGDYAYIASSEGLQIFDISDPENPTGIGLFDGEGQGGMKDVAIRGNFAYVTEGAYFQPNNFYIIDISDPVLPSLEDKTLTGGTMAMNKISLYDDYAYITDFFPGGGLNSVNINPGSASYLQTYGPFYDLIPGNDELSNGIVAMGGYAYVAYGEAGNDLAIVDISDPSSMTLILKKDFSGTNVKDILVSGKHAFLLDGTLGISIIKLY